MNVTPKPEDLVPESDVAAIMRGTHGDPFGVLGMHGGGGAPLSVRVFAPQAAEVRVLDGAGQPVATLDRIGAEGFFAGIVPGDEPFAYRLRFCSGPHEWEAEDPYRFPAVLGELDEYLMGEGRHYQLYTRLGAHPVTLEGVEGVSFAVWAPSARRVSVVGAFNAWDGRRHPMRKRIGVGVWELFIPGLQVGDLYKYEILGPSGERLPLKSDPLSFAQEAPPATASLVHGLPEPDWHDAGWMQERASRQDRSAPISIYEVHAGSWKLGLDYDAQAEELATYVREMGFTHVEFLPISEHPFTGSWGYQPIGLFAPTARFGPPEGFARLVDRLHREGIGVILDWVPAHFPSDAHGLANFDGTHLYDHADPRQGFHRDWNTQIYNFGRQEVANFLQASALFWLDRYHVDALRVDAVASMLYLDYSRNAGEWVPNRHGGRENLEAIDFLRAVNERVRIDHPGCITIAEESTAFPQVSRPVQEGGLGFGFKWNMGWMHDTLGYFRRDPIHRRHHQNDLTFGMVYAFSEDFVLPLSHDEVVHGKGSLIGQMAGDRWQKFANLRAYFGFMWAHPGKKLLFMGGEFAQEREWNHDASLDWHLLDDPAHSGMKRLVADLNREYRRLPALHRMDCDPEGFEWIDAGDTENSVLSFLRKAPGEKPVLAVCNLTPVVRSDYRIGVPQGGEWREILNSDAAIYGGSDVGNPGSLQAEEVSWHGRPFSVRLTLPPLATILVMPA
ncbi:1,4-alpha-glucan branching protein GlgB [Cereibacter azotoformans]|uniref:1,4-alpha-glucan branching enzyme GlgB n=1 Tax=Cereibacter azotoformans TaxID=43057 RepID=A0A2T5KDP1_9RHOB|nr:1,4-alpha-glucan branching protein GlgB [Cereibacter azotoformans]MBO4168469.1 1,4-alpha-glucan branching protein GlgB [Cereibacter azotoformans]PTR20543.1 1,4-alpha-glucan branching enzyme [Cereibacter azotoformans]